MHDSIKTFIDYIQLVSGGFTWFRGRVRRDGCVLLILWCHGGGRVAAGWLTGVRRAQSEAETSRCRTQALSLELLRGQSLRRLKPETHTHPSEQTLRKHCRLRTFLSSQPQLRTHSHAACFQEGNVWSERRRKNVFGFEEKWVKKKGWGGKSV